MCVCVWERERQTERQRQRERKTEPTQLKSSTSLGKEGRMKETGQIPFGYVQVWHKAEVNRPEADI